MITTIPDDIAEIFKDFLGVKRLNLFLQAEDVDHLDEQHSNDNTEFSIKGTIAWDKPKSVPDTSHTPFQLRNLDLTFMPRQMTLIAGKFGSGKTLLLLSLLGEARVLEGTATYALSSVHDPAQVHQPGTASSSGVAYVPQVGSKAAAVRVVH